jgi:hypothetical protein
MENSNFRHTTGYLLFLTEKELADLKSGCERSPHVPSETVKRVIAELEFLRNKEKNHA